LLADIARQWHNLYSFFERKCLDNRGSLHVKEIWLANRGEDLSDLWRVLSASEGRQYALITAAVKRAGFPWAVNVVANFGEPIFSDVGTDGSGLE
jgi:hypothetical protein